VLLRFIACDKKGCVLAFFVRRYLLHHCKTFLDSDWLLKFQDTFIGYFQSDNTGLSR
jgi:hypothetical protein